MRKPARPTFSTALTLIDPFLRCSSVFTMISTQTQFQVYRLLACLRTGDTQGTTTWRTHHVSRVVADRELNACMPSCLALQSVFLLCADTRVLGWVRMQDACKRCELHVYLRPSLKRSCGTRVRYRVPREQSSHTCR